MCRAVFFPLLFFSAFILIYLSSTCITGNYFFINLPAFVYSCSDPNYSIQIFLYLLLQRMIFVLFLFLSQLFRSSIVVSVIELKYISINCLKMISYLIFFFIFIIPFFIYSAFIKYNIWKFVVSYSLYFIYSSLVFAINNK